MDPNNPDLAPSTGHTQEPTDDAGQATAPGDANMTLGEHGSDDYEVLQQNLHAQTPSTAPPRPHVILRESETEIERANRRELELEEAERRAEIEYMQRPIKEDQISDDLRNRMLARLETADRSYGASGGATSPLRNQFVPQSTISDEEQQPSNLTESADHDITYEDARRGESDEYPDYGTDEGDEIDVLDESESRPTEQSAGVRPSTASESDGSHSTSESRSSSEDASDDQENKVSRDPNHPAYLQQWEEERPGSPLGAQYAQREGSSSAREGDDSDSASGRETSPISSEGDLEFITGMPIERGPRQFDYLFRAAAQTTLPQNPSVALSLKRMALRYHSLARDDKIAAIGANITDADLKIQTTWANAAAHHYRFQREQAREIHIDLLERYQRMNSDYEQIRTYSEHLETEYEKVRVSKVERDEECVDLQGDIAVMHDDFKRMEEKNCRMIAELEETCQLQRPYMTRVKDWEEFRVSSEAQTELSVPAAMSTADYCRGFNAATMRDASTQVDPEEEEEEEEEDLYGDHSTTSNRPTVDRGTSPKPPSSTTTSRDKPATSPQRNSSPFRFALSPPRNAKEACIRLPSGPPPGYEWPAHWYEMQAAVRSTDEFHQRAEAYRRQIQDALDARMAQALSEIE